MGIELPFERMAEIILTESTTTDEKEVTVCVIADLCANFGNNMTTALQNTDAKSRIDNVLSSAKVKTVNDLARILAESTYNLYDNSVSNIVNYLKLLGLDSATKSDKIIEQDSIKSGVAIYKRYGNVYLIRDKANFETIKALGPILWKKEFQGEQLFEDNWNPSDIFITKTTPSSITKEALKATSLIIEDINKPLNGYFADPRKSSFDDFVGISLKQESTDAQAGKGTKFSKNVTMGEVPESIGAISKGTKNSMSYYKGFKRYATNPNKSDMEQSALKILDKGWRVYGVSKSTDVGKKLWDRFNLDTVYKELKSIKTIKNYHSLQEKPESVIKFIEGVTSKAESIARNEGSIKDKQRKFVDSRNRFIDALKQSKVKVDTLTKSEDLFSSMKKIYKNKSSEFDVYIVQKICTYDFFVDIFNNWSTATTQLKPYFQRISNISNPFVALAMFCIAEAGISPMFTKLKGSSWDDFTHDYTIDSKKSAKDVKIIDNPTAAGFDVEFKLAFGTKNYDVKLSFRFANSSIRAEVSELKLV